MAICLIGLGSNLGDRQATLENAVREIERLPQTSVQRISRLHEFPPLGGPAGQNDFLNAAALLATTLQPEQVLSELQQVEVHFGRTSGERWAARPLDLDLLLYDDRTIHSPQLDLPHRRLSFRRFVLVPAAEIAPEMRVPNIGWSIGELLTHLQQENDRLAIISPSLEHRNQLCRFIAERYHGIRAQPTSGGADVDLWPPPDTDWMSFSKSPGAVPIADQALRDPSPKLTILLHPDSAQSAALGRGPTLLLHAADLPEIEREVAAALLSVWPDLG